jgi:hypothetical protein
MKRLICSLFLVLTIVSAAWADTIYLKDGRKIEGDVLRFENGQFVVQVSNPRSRTGYDLVYFGPQEIDRIVIEGRSEKSNRNGSGQSSGGQYDEKTVQVVLADNWVDTGITLKRGQHVRVDATGSVFLNGRTESGPDGLSSRHDPKAPSPSAPEGSLVGAIGEDQNAKVLTLGSSTEFQADRDGKLYLTVNKSDYRDARGSYQVRLGIEKGGRSDGGYNRQSDSNPDRPDRNNDRNNNPPTDPDTSRQSDKTVTVNGSDAWTDAGVRVQRGMRISFSASGEIHVSRNKTADPDGSASDLGTIFNRYPMPDIGTGALIGKIILDDGSETQPFFIGKSKKDYVVSQSGRLYLGVNDSNFGDNDGTFTVIIRF